MDIKTHVSSFFVSLGSDIDYFKFCQISNSAKVEVLNMPNGLIYFQVKSLESASQLCRKFINEFNLCSSNWIGGRIVDENYNFIAQVSYNGRVWKDEKWNDNSIEINLC